MTIREGQLVVTCVNEKWQSNSYWDCSNLEWVKINSGAPCLIISVDLQKVCFTHQGRLYSIHNCYDDKATGLPVWCSVL